ncbi:PAP2 superfamily-domain-containing protein [Thelonectria olida]|uniref:PAP2 superfamily-domain-containing protein n=1 Tax=Thelonectria olida TaxID=1576542 RepID=A0A9P8WC88_9HYPO|nr:PAP2 superfamily-domain-containing protein [Thelonectria olida]
MALFPRAYQRMGDSAFTGFANRHRRGISMRLAFSYAFDWVALIIAAGIAAALGHIEPHKRPFSLVSQDISFPFTEHELVPAYLLIILNALVPIVIILIVTLILVPGTTVSKNTPRSLVMKRKLWELHVGWLGLALALISAWAFTESMKNLFGKPRPDLLDRCKPDLKNINKYIVGGFALGDMNGQLVSHEICTQTDMAILNDGFRSYPSGHSSSAAAGLIYLSLFLASKFSVTIPYVMPSAASAAGSVHGNKAFPSRLRSEVDRYEPARVPTTRSTGSSPDGPKDGDYEEFNQNMKVQSLRRQAAAPPIYLLIGTVLPFGIAVFVAGSRWHDYRHTGFDIVFGFLMGTVTAIYAFRYYHLPIQVGAGWAWGPRSDERAFWAGVGRLGFVGEDEEMQTPPGPRQPRTHQGTGFSTNTGFSANTSYPATTSGAVTQRPVPTHHQDHDSDLEEGIDRRPATYEDVELQQIQPPPLSETRETKSREPSPPPRLPPLS